MLPLPPWGWQGRAMQRCFPYSTLIKRGHLCVGLLPDPANPGKDIPSNWRGTTKRQKARQRQTQKVQKNKLNPNHQQKIRTGACSCQDPACLSPGGCHLCKCGPRRQLKEFCSLSQKRQPSSSCHRPGSGDHGQHNSWLRGFCNYCVVS